MWEFFSLKNHSTLSYSIAAAAHLISMFWCFLSSCCPTPFTNFVKTVVKCMGFEKRESYFKKHLSWHFVNLKTTFILNWVLILVKYKESKTKQNKIILKTKFFSLLLNKLNNHLLFALKLFQFCLDFILQLSHPFTVPT